jgi:hypothetical protein
MLSRLVLRKMGKFLRADAKIGMTDKAQKMEELVFPCALVNISRPKI